MSGPLEYLTLTTFKAWSVINHSDSDMSVSQLDIFTYYLWVSLADIDLVYYF